MEFKSYNNERVIFLFFIYTWKYAVHLTFFKLLSDFYRLCCLFRTSVQSVRPSNKLDASMYIVFCILISFSLKTLSNLYHTIRFLILHLRQQSLITHETVWFSDHPPLLLLQWVPRPRQQTVQGFDDNDFKFIFVHFLQIHFLTKQMFNLTHFFSMWTRAYRMELSRKMCSWLLWVTLSSEVRML